MSDPPKTRLAKRHRIRVDLSSYERSGETWFITIAALNRRRLPLLDARAAGVVCTSLATAHDLHGCAILAFRVMSDHLHTETYVREGGNLIKLINSFNSYSTRAWWGVGGAGELWQRSFHDRGLRSVADIEATVAYVWENPVRWGLADDEGRYPFRGGVLLDDA